jgi:hypothetical protein
MLDFARRMASMTSGRRAKGIEPSYSAWKGIAKPNDLKGGSEK